MEESITNSHEKSFLIGVQSFERLPILYSRPYSDMFNLPAVFINKSALTFFNTLVSPKVPLI